jgi:glycosyltransferase involved in cell wall biosynthesis
VVHVSDSDDFGGTEQVILSLLAGLDSRRWTCVLLHRARRGSAPLIDGADSLGIRHYDTNGHRTVRLASLAHMVAQLRSLRAAVVHAHLTDPLACRFILCAAAIARVPAVASAHLITDVSAASTTRHRIIAAIVDRYIAVSEHVAVRLRSQLGVPARKIRLVRNAVPFDRFAGTARGRLHQQLTAGRNLRVVLTVARLDLHKGHRYLLEAVARVPDALFVLAGDGREHEALKRQASDLGVADRVVFLGYRDDIPELLANCDVFVLPSLVEGLPLAVLEAMASGRPIVATAIGGTAEAVIDGETGLLVEPRDAGALARAIQAVMKDEVLAGRLGAAGRARAAKCFGVEPMIRGVAQVYEELLA